MTNCSLKMGSWTVTRGQLVEVAGRVGVVVLAVLEVVVAHGIAVNAVEGQHDHDGEVGKQKERCRTS